ncbi:GntR family transcriptional regulator [Streptomyces sp. NPDC088354]|uniref:GntR family transcriptional regulator n=1 Tax=Streptomyces sp. NPDC088354 TaxID=3365856 RepID=UPI003800D3B4
MIIERMMGGTYPSGGEVPSTVQIAVEFGVVDSLAQRTIERVRADRLTRFETATGTFVLRPEERDGPWTGTVAALTRAGRRR